MPRPVSSLEGGLQLTAPRAKATDRPHVPARCFEARRIVMKQRAGFAAAPWYFGKLAVPYRLTDGFPVAAYFRSRMPGGRLPFGALSPFLLVLPAVAQAETTTRASCPSKERGGLQKVPEEAESLGDVARKPTSRLYVPGLPTEGRSRRVPKVPLRSMDRPRPRTHYVAERAEAQITQADLPCCAPTDTYEPTRPAYTAAGNVRLSGPRHAECRPTGRRATPTSDRLHPGRAVSLSAASFTRPTVSPRSR